MSTSTIRVTLHGGRGYDILVGRGLVRRVGALARRAGVRGRPFVVTSPRIGKLHLRPLVAGLKAAGWGGTGVAYVPDGDAHKNLAAFARVSSQLVAFGAKRGGRPFVVNLGGGVVGDLGGFVAAAYRRGTDLVQVPTTLLGFVDCGIGGKTGVNHAGVKNILGAFHQPRLVVADLDLLRTLPVRELRSGMAEVVKHGVIASPALFAFVRRNIARVFALDPAVMSRIAADNYRIKAGIVEHDEFDTKGIRAVLNFGHTVGHAVESASCYRLRHGEAVSIGMACANDIAVALGMLSRRDALEVEGLLEALGLPVRVRGLGAARVMRSFWSDKKFTTGKARMVLATRIGRVVVRDGVPVPLIEKVIRTRT